MTADGIEFEVDNALFINTVKSSLYSVWNWQNLADLLAFTEAGAPPAITAEHYTALLNDLTASDPAPVPFDNNPLGFSQCSAVIPLILATPGYGRSPQ